MYRAKGVANVKKCTREVLDFKQVYEKYNFFE